MNLYTKAQLLRIVMHWGYCEGNLPKSTERETTVYIPAEFRQTVYARARLTWEIKNGAGQRLFGLTFVA